MAEEQKCAWKDREGEEHECGREVTHDGGTHCVFHAEEKDAREFRDALARLIRKWRKEKAREWDFRGFQFVDYERKPGEKQPNLFHHAVFAKAADFESAQFRGPASFRSAQFRGSASFRSAQFRGDADFWSATFGGSAYFASSQFHERAEFLRANFQNRAVFSNAFFRKWALFSGAVFQARAIFSNSKFSEVASFVHVEFAQRAEFRDTEFMNWVRLHSASFAKRAEFWGATFKGYASFVGCRFAGQMDFTYVSFAVLGDFDKCKIIGNVKWIWPGDGKKADSEGKEVKRGRVRFRELRVFHEFEFDMTHNLLQKDTYLIFEECEMHRIRLVGTDCTQIEFYANKWKELDGRGVVGDENLAEETLRENGSAESIRWELIQLTYQQLSSRFRADFFHQRANNFDRGVFEMRRRMAKKEGNLRGYFNYVLISLYRRISRYSGSLTFPLLWLIFGTLLFGWIYTLCLPGYSVTWNPCNADWEAIGKAYGQSIQVLNLGKPAADSVLSGGIWIELLKLFQRVFSATMITLFIFAIRRRFKH